MESKKRKTTSDSECDSSSNGDNDNNGRLIKKLDLKVIAKRFECPVCTQTMLPPIFLCVGGHAVCNLCQENLESCPLCRRGFTEARNWIAEDLLDECGVRCKFWESGCPVGLPGRELSAHHQVCNYRPLVCPKCKKDIPFHDYLYHLSYKEGWISSWQFQLNHDITAEEFKDRNRYNYARALVVGEPVWILAHGRDFFCFLDNRNSDWWIWVAGYATPKECERFTCFIKVSNQRTQNEVGLFTDVHPIETSPYDVFASGSCLSFRHEDLKSRFKRAAKLEVMIRIDLGGDENVNGQRRTVVKSYLPMTILSKASRLRQRQHHHH